nr:LysR family transcriptional regulator [uncultured Holophaga sp.]
MDTRQIRCFLGVAEHLSFTGAARQLGLTHSAVGYQVAALEVEVGTRLFERSSRSVRLTAAGAHFLRRIRPILNSYGGLLQSTRSIGEGLAGEVRLGFIGGGEERFLPLFLKRFKREFPGIRVKVAHYSLKELRERLVEGSLDIAFSHVRAVEDLPGLRSELLFESPIGVLLPSDHPLAEGPLWLSDLAGEAFIEPAPSLAPPSLTTHQDFWSRLGGRPQELQQTQDFGTLFMLVESGAGLSLLPRYMFDPKAHPHLAFRELEDWRPTLKGCIAWHAQGLRPTLQVFLKALGVLAGAARG